MRHAKWTPGTKENKQYQREWMKVWRLKNPENGRRQSYSARRWQSANPTRNAINCYRKRAERKGLPFSLEESRFAELVKASCVYCGAEAKPINGIDRLDNAMGYVEGNVVTACVVCNRAKQCQSRQQFEVWILRVAQRLPFMTDKQRSA